MHEHVDFKPVIARGEKVRDFECLNCLGDGMRLMSRGGILIPLWQVCEICEGRGNTVIQMMIARMDEGY